MSLLPNGDGSKASSTNKVLKIWCDGQSVMQRSVTDAFTEAVTFTLCTI